VSREYAIYDVYGKYASPLGRFYSFAEAARFIKHVLPDEREVRIHRIECDPKRERARAALANTEKQG
jgi:hypothetical protein